MDVIYNEAFESPNMLNIHYIHPLPPKFSRVYMHVLKTFEFFESNRSDPKFDSIRFDYISAHIKEITKDSINR